MVARFQIWARKMFDQALPHPWYWETITNNLKLLETWQEDYAIRHLVMPGHLECCTLPIFKWIKANTPQALLNIMGQYHPDNYCNPDHPAFEPKYLELTRKITRKELITAFSYADRLKLNYRPLTFDMIGATRL